jgi:hypothetical protein
LQVSLHDKPLANRLSGREWVTGDQSQQLASGLGTIRRSPECIEAAVWPKNADVRPLHDTGREDAVGVSQLPGLERNGISWTDTAKCTKQSFPVPSKCYIPAAGSRKRREGDVTDCTAQDRLICAFTDSLIKMEPSDLQPPELFAVRHG